MGSNDTARHHRSAHRGGRHRWRRSVVTVGLAGTLVLAACGGGNDDAASESALDTAAPTDSPGDEYLATSEEAPQTAGDSAADFDNGNGFDLGIVGRDVIIEMQVTMSSDDIQRTVASITASALTLGGGVSSADVDFGDQNDPAGSQGYAVLVVKVPPDAVDRLLSGLDSSGDVLRINQSAQDVTDQLVNLDVRIENAAESVANVRRFMERTEDLTELVTLEGELTRRQTELEQLEAQRRNISDRVALSTITIDVIPTSSVPEPIDESNSIGDAFRNGWDAFTSLLFGIAYVLAALLPFLVVGALGLLTAAWVVRRRRANAGEARPPVSETATVLPPPTDERTTPLD